MVENFEKGFFFMLGAFAAAFVVHKVTGARAPMGASSSATTERPGSVAEMAQG